AVLMFQQVRVPVLGIVENMSYMIAPQSGERIDVFGEGGGRRTAHRMEVPFLGELPLDPQVRIGGDSGRPVALRGEDDPGAAPFYAIARKVAEAVEAAATRKTPSITISD